MAPVDSHGLLSRLRALRVSVRRFVECYRIPIVLAAICAFATLFIYSASRLDLDPREIGWNWLGLAAAIVPFAMLANASELALCARATGRTMPIATAFIYSAGATVANVLPLPAGMILRAKALVGEGAGWIESGAILAAAGLLWLAMAVTSVGFALMPDPSGTIIFVAGCSACLVIAGWVALGAGVATGTGFLLVRGAMIALLVLRLYFCFLAIGQPLALPDSAVFALAGVVGNGVTIVPSGLGIAEGVGAAMADLVGTLPAAAFLALGINRLLGLAGSALATGAYILIGRSNGATEQVVARTS
jgi:hypothetical protein